LRSFDDFILCGLREAPILSRANLIFYQKSNQAMGVLARDMIARNPRNHEDQWLVSAQYFADNFEAA
jgi:hypothetical protein